MQKCYLGIGLYRSIISEDEQSVSVSCFPLHAGPPRELLVEDDVIVELLVVKDVIVRVVAVLGQVSQKIGHL